MSENLSESQERALEIFESSRGEMSEFHQKIWGYAEPAWREYRSARAYVDLLRDEGFEVEEGTGGMPTAFRANWGESGPIVGLYSEYDATPGLSQAAVPYRAPRNPDQPWEPGWTDAHAALGVAALSGALALKNTLDETGIPGRIQLFGEPAEKVCGSKPVHAAKGYYDDLDFAISYHPGMTNTAFYGYQSCLYWSVVFTFQCTESEPWLNKSPFGNVTPQNAVRSPGAVAAIGQMLSAVNASRDSMFPKMGTWTLSETILGGANATADNLPQRITQIQFSWRSPLLEVQEQIAEVLRRCAKHAAGITNCEVTERWITKTRPGLKNIALASATYDKLVAIGPEALAPEAFDFARSLESSLGCDPSDQPFVDSYATTEAPSARDEKLRAQLPPWQDCTVADDYTEYTWHTPTVRFTTAKLSLNVVGPHMSHWAHNAMNGFAPTIDHLWSYAGKVIATTALEVLESPSLLAEIKREFVDARAAAPEALREPLLDSDFEAPIDLPWPEYHTTERGYEWILPPVRDYGDPVE